MTASLQRLRKGRPITWSTILGLLLVPLTAAGVLIWGLWNPTERLEHITAAVVNLDKPVEIDGQPVPLGRVLAAELIAGDATQNYTWVLTDESDAEAGLDEGRYATVVTIPKNFSSAATSMARGANEATTATIDVETSQRGRLLDAALSNIVTTTATNVLNQQLGSQFVGGVFVGMNELGRGIGDAASGARGLATGGAALADGASELADGAAQLAQGTAQLSGGAAELSGGAATLSSGAAGLAAGAGGLAAGADGLASGADELAVGARDAAAGGSQLANGVTEYTGLVNGVLAQVIAGAGQAVAPLQHLRSVLAQLPDDVPLPDGYTKATLLATVDALIAELSAASSDDPSSRLVQLREAGTQLSGAAQASAAGQQQLAEGLSGYAAGVHQLAGGAHQLAGGASQLAGGAGQLAGGAAQLAAGVPALAEGASGVADGSSQLADGARQAADGSASLADGLRGAVDEIPSYSDAERERLASLAVQPVEAQGEGGELFNASGVPLFAGLALWAGAFASYLVLAPLWRRSREAARGVGSVTWRSVLPAVSIGAAQGAILGLLLPPLLGYAPGAWAGFFGLALLAGISFSLVNQGLSAMFGGVGRFIAFALLVIGFAIGVVSTAPPILQAIGDASPLGALFAGFGAVATGVTGAGSAAALLVLWAAGGVLLTALAVARERRSLAL